MLLSEFFYLYSTKNLFCQTKTFLIYFWSKLKCYEESRFFIAVAIHRFVFTNQ